MTPARLRTLREISEQRPVAGNDDGWVIPQAPRGLVGALREGGLIERKGSGVMCGMDLHRITDAGRRALAACIADVEG